MTPERLAQIREKPWFVSGKEVEELLEAHLELELCKLAAMGIYDGRANTGTFKTFKAVWALKGLTTITEEQRVAIVNAPHADDCVLWPSDPGFDGCDCWKKNFEGW